jgi:hypothetical protein
MNIEETIIKQLQTLPPAEQAEALNFIKYLRDKALSKEARNWETLSLISAMREMEDEQTPYLMDDLKEIF